MVLNCFRFIYVYFVYISILPEWKYVQYMCEVPVETRRD